MKHRIWGTQSATDLGLRLRVNVMKWSFDMLWSWIWIDIELILYTCWNCGKHLQNLRWHTLTRGSRLCMGLLSPTGSYWLPLALLHSRAGQCLSRSAHTGKKWNMNLNLTFYWEHGVLAVLLCYCTDCHVFLYLPQSLCGHAKPVESSATGRRTPQPFKTQCIAALTLMALRGLCPHVECIAAGNLLHIS